MINLCGNLLSFGASRTSFTYSAAPARRLSFAHPSLILRLSFAYPSLNLRHILGCASSPTFLRSTFAQGSLGEIMNFELARED